MVTIDKYGTVKLEMVTEHVLIEDFEFTSTDLPGEDDLIARKAQQLVCFKAAKIFYKKVSFWNKMKFLFTVS